MAKCFLILTTLAIIVLAGASKVSAKDIQLYAGEITVTIPDDFVKLTPDQIAIKFGNNPRSPKIVYADTPDRMKMTIAIGHKPGVRMPPFNNAAAVEFKKILSGARNISKWNAAKAITTKSNTVLFFDFETPALESVDYNIRNFMIMGSNNGAQNIINVNCTTDIDTKCQALIDTLLLSLKM
ncbi:MAG: hypothetical protein L3J65_07330 [Robiginitomaculum sp.]|nr:hypothetical protein [Robiginitomaculum sp.]